MRPRTGVFVWSLVVASVAFMLALAGTTAARANHCRKDCKPAVSDCLARVPSNKRCTGTKPEKRLCRRAHAQARKTCHRLVVRCKVENPVTANVCVATTTMPGNPGCGMFVTAWGTAGSGDGQFDHPIGVAIDAGGNVYVGEGFFGGRIQKFVRRARRSASAGRSRDSNRTPAMPGAAAGRPLRGARRRAARAGATEVKMTKAATASARGIRRGATPMPRRSLRPDDAAKLAQRHFHGGPSRYDGRESFHDVCATATRPTSARPSACGSTSDAESL
jgi:hypothetical protein